MEAYSHQYGTALPDPDTLPVSVTRSLSLLKKVMAIAGYKLGQLPQDVAAVIIGAVNDLLEEKEYGKEWQVVAIPVDEALLNVVINKKIIAAAQNAKITRHGRKIDIRPLEHLDLGHLSLCTLFNAIRVALVQETCQSAVPALRKHAATLRGKSLKNAIGAQHGDDWATQFE